jgi:hypothetical protein
VKENTAMSQRLIARAYSALGIALPDTLRRRQERSGRSWRERLGAAAGPWNPVGARMLAAHIGHADRPVSYSTEGFVLRKGSR